MHMLPVAKQTFFIHFVRAESRFQGGSFNFEPLRQPLEMD